MSGEGSGLRRRLSRRGALALIAGSACLPAATRAEEVIALSWDDLLPEGQEVLPEPLRGMIRHDTPAYSAPQPASVGVRTEWDGKIVRLSGFIVPVEFKGAGVTSFILVPYVGACVHVPPPPANQLVFVTTERPYEGLRMFEAVHVTGMFGTAATSTQLAQISYALSADLIEPYG